jgi:general secretion pathway protein G
MILHSPNRLEAAQRRSAFTLLEVLIVVAIIVILASVSGVYVFRAYEDAKISTARAKAISLATACQQFMVKYERYPESLNELIQPPSGNQPFVEPDALNDPWGKQFTYDQSGQHNNGLKPDVYTTTPTGEVVGNWKQ